MIGHEILNIQLPTHHFDGDKKWIIEKLSELPPYARKRAIDGYSAVYKEEYDKEPVCFRKEGAGRRAANKRLREFVERFQTIMNEKVNTPPKTTDSHS